MISYAKAALAFLEAAGVLTKLAIAAGLVAAAVTAYGLWHHRVYESGVRDTIAGIARADAKWIDRASAARGKWKQCHEQNRGWDQTTGRCL